MIIEKSLAGTKFSSAMILYWNMEPEKNYNFWTKSSMGGNHFCGSTHRPSPESYCWSYMHNPCVTSVAMLILKLDIVPVGFLE